jgi:MFS family permease
LEDKVVAPVPDKKTSSTRQGVGLRGGFILLLLATLGVAIAYYVGVLGRSLAMDDLGYSAAAISSTAAVGGALTLPLPPLMGWLSDRTSRKRLLACCYLAGTTGLLALAVSVSLWQFWLSFSLLYILFNAGSGVGSAFVTDLVPQASLGRGISLFRAATSIGGIIGFAATGHAVQKLGVHATSIGGALLTVLAIVLLVPIRKVGQGNGLASHSRRDAA